MRSILKALGFAERYETTAEALVRLRTQEEIQNQRGRLNNAIQNVESTSRVMQNMAGMMVILGSGDDK